MEDVHSRTFKAGSKTYYNSSLWFPREIRKDVFILYGFVRVADNFVDRLPQDEDGFKHFCQSYQRALGGKTIGDPIIDDFVDLKRRKAFPDEWVEAFLYSMELDLNKQVYQSLGESLEYIYGSAEVIGYFMARIMDLRDGAYPYAALLGRAMQYINFIRDIDEDRDLGRIYLPFEDSGLEKLEDPYLEKHREKFISYIHHHIQRYREWQEEAEKGFALIPPRFRIPIKTASDMYKWTSEQIYKDPFVVLEKKMKPGRPRIIAQAVHNSLTSLFTAGS